MTTSMEQFKDLFSAGDPMIREKFLLKTITPMITIVSSYVFFVKVIGPAIMEKRKPIDIRRIMIFYNFSLAFFYVYLIVKGVQFVPKLGFSFFCGALDSQNPVVADFFALGYEMYVVRYIELLDTVFLVLSKKFNMITPLHVFHHAVVPIFGWLGFRTETSAYLSVFIGINGFVHVVMYTYYAIASLGPYYQKYLWWKKYLTSLQILQFLFMTLYLLFMSAIGCITSKITFAICVFLNVFFFFLFVNYYRRTFLTDENKEK
ncbi:elongation of very long chain fatty acids protein 7-like [Stegodyphus dumicola]|uniref:elongation of very long chain fatty acids protein 7-like n=1 Tax=Stegodyphus dumicola TaxID=202533 RepID=UPI0015AACBE8|nr:elongation of very long chain fatty acids protein 7-like [Stegodyphus dumicola]